MIFRGFKYNLMLGNLLRIVERYQMSALSGELRAVSCQK